MNSILIFLIGNLLLTASAFAGGSSVGNGGDWFVRTLPLLKIQLPEDFGVVEGVQYKKVGLRKCSEDDLKRLEIPANVPDVVNAIYLPNREWKAYRVLIEGGKNLICSFGLADGNPTTALKTLVQNEDTDRVLYADYPDVGRQIKYSKSLGTISKLAYSIPALGTFLTNLDPRGTYAGYNLQDGLRVLGFPKSLYFKPQADAVDFVYIPLSIQDRNRPYFVQTVIDNSNAPVWRIILPVAFSQEDLPLAALAQALRESSGTGVWEAFYGIKFDPFVDHQLTQSIAWSSFNTTPTSKSLRMDLAHRHNFSEYAVMARPDLLSPQFNISFLPSVVDGHLNHAAFRHGETSGEMLLPVVSQRWRIGADVVHEITHALQQPCPIVGCSDDRLFEMEMEAHLNERQHLKEMVEILPMSKYADDAFNYLVAASLPNVMWANTLQKPVQRDLCEDVIISYQLDPAKIQNGTLKKFNCQMQFWNSHLTSRRRK